MMFNLSLSAICLLSALAGGEPPRADETRLPTGRFVLVEGALLKRKVDLPKNNIVVVEGQPVITKTIVKTPLTKSLKIDALGNFEESIFAGTTRMNADEGKWRYRVTGPQQVELRSPGGEKRTFRFSFRSGRLTLNFGKKSLEVYRKE